LAPYSGLQFIHSAAKAAQQGARSPAEHGGAEQVIDFKGEISAENVIDLTC
jgi:hypothetical protein